MKIRPAAFETLVLQNGFLVFLSLHFPSPRRMLTKAAAAALAVLHVFGQGRKTMHEAVRISSRVKASYFRCVLLFLRC